MFLLVVLYDVNLADRLVYSLGIEILIKYALISSAKV